MKAKRFTIRFVMVALLVSGLGFIYQSFAPFTGDIRYMWLAVPFVLIGGGYYIGNIIRNERAHRAA